MTAKQVQDELISATHDAVALLDVTGWELFGNGYDVYPCQADGKIKFAYQYAAPEQPASRDRAADAKIVADYWESIGITTVTKGKPDSVVVFAQSENITSISFSTGPGLYRISGTSRCVEGNIDDFGGEQ